VRPEERRVAGSVLLRRARLVAAALADVVRRRRRFLGGSCPSTGSDGKNGLLERVLSFRYGIVH